MYKQRPVPRLLSKLARAKTPSDKEQLLFRFAATMDAELFYDPSFHLQSSSPATRDGNQLERDVQSLLEALFGIFQEKVPEEYQVEPPARFAALRALGAFVQGSTPVPTVLSEDWKQPHVPLYLAAIRVLTQIFEKGTTQYVFGIRCLSVLALQALQVMSPLNPVDCAVSSILSSPSRQQQLQQQNNSSQPRGGNPSDPTATTIASASHSSSFTSSSSGTQNNNNNENNNNKNQAASDTIMLASTASPFKIAKNEKYPTGTPLRIIPRLTSSASPSASSSSVSPSHDNSQMLNISGDENNNNNNNYSTINTSTNASYNNNNNESFLNFESLFMDHLLSDPILRPLVIDLWRLWDAAGIDVRVFTSCPESIHVFFPTRLLSSVSCVYRDFVTCPERPKMEKPWSGNCEIHIKTNIKSRSEVMYRILIEGYNYGMNAPIQTEIVGAAKRHWDKPGGDNQIMGNNMGVVGAGQNEHDQSSPSGSPSPSSSSSSSSSPVSRMCKDYAEGCKSTQYYSSGDQYLVIKLMAKSFFGVGFTASAWMVFHGHAPGFPIEGEVFHQEEDL